MEIAQQISTCSYTQFYGLFTDRDPCNSPDNINAQHSDSEGVLPTAIDTAKGSLLIVLSCDWILLWGIGAAGQGQGQSCFAVWYLNPYFGYFILPPRWLVGVMPCSRKSQENYTKEKPATDKRRRRFFYTFLYLLGSTTIPWMRKFFLNTLKWLNPPVKVSKIR